MPGFLRILFLAAVATVVVLPDSAVATEDNPGVWAAISTTGAFRANGERSRWQYRFDAHARYLDVGSGINQEILRAAVGYEFPGGLRGWLGYARIRARNSIGDVASENRYWQQLDWSTALAGDSRLTLRARLEQQSVSIGDDLGIRFRVMARYDHPVSRSGDIRFIAAVEPFFDLRDTDWGGEAGFGQNRVFLGIGWRLGNNVVLETAYVNQYLRLDDSDDLVNHLALVHLRTSF